MAKYLIALVMLAFLVLENKNIYSGVNAKSQHVTHLMRPPPHRHHTPVRHHNHPTRVHHYAHHGRSHKRTQHQEQYFEGGEEKDGAAAILTPQQYEHMQRHREEQRRHENEHRRQLRQRLRGAIVQGEESLRSMLRFWQHFSNFGNTTTTTTTTTTTNNNNNNKKKKKSDKKNNNKDTKREDRMYGDGPLGGRYADESHENDMMSVEMPLSLEDGFASKSVVEDYSDNRLGSSEEENFTTTRKTTRFRGGEPQLRCPKCRSGPKVERVSEEELTRLRIEFVKQQILEKLRLKERPNVHAIGLPRPIYEGTTIQHENDRANNKDLDDYYARTSKKFIFLQVEKRECQRLDQHPSVCFSFKINDADVDGYDVNTAVLWIFKNKQQKRSDTILNKQTIVVSEVQQQPDPLYLPIIKTIAIQSVDVQDEWMKIDIEWPIKRWFGNHDLSHLIHITCQSCDIDSMEEMISTDKDYRPFIMVDTQNRRRQARPKRTINCTDGVTECCREKLYISFDEIGWGDWIIQPRGYDAYFCRGSCNSVASVAMSMSHHSTFLQKFLTRHNNRRKHLELVPCCTAKQYSSLQLVFMDSNNTATQKTFPNMVVESCGCR